jgi:hypothetical protein
VIVHMEEEDVAYNYFTKSRKKYEKILRISDITFKTLFDLREVENKENMTEFKGYKDIPEFTPEETNGYITKNQLLGIYFIHNFKIQSSFVQKNYDDEIDILEMVIEPGKARGIHSFIDVSKLETHDKSLVTIAEKELLKTEIKIKKKKNFLNFFNLSSKSEEKNDEEVSLLDVMKEDQWNPYFILFSTKYNILSHLLFYEIVLILEEKYLDERMKYVDFILNTFLNPKSIFDVSFQVEF